MGSHSLASNIHHRTGMGLQIILSLCATELLLEPSGGRAILVDSALVAKRSPAPPAAEDAAVEEDTEITEKVDKRAAILLDKIMYAVQKALDEDKNGKIAAGHPNLASFASARHANGLDNKVYWKCYFNAVSCF